MNGISETLKKNIEKLSKILTNDLDTGIKSLYREDIKALKKMIDIYSNLPIELK